MYEWEKESDIMAEFLSGIGAFLLYLLPLALILLALRIFTKVPDELFRKLLHFVLLGAYVPFLFGFAKWWHCVAFIVGFGVILFPTLKLLAKVKGFSSFVNERKNGEFTGSMLLALGVMAVSISIGWGIFSDKYIVLASVYVWGVGDGFAALIGKCYGKHKIKWSFVDNKKSFEGSLAMLITSAIAVFTVLMLRGGIAPLWCVLVALLAASASTFMELCSKGGVDTVTCPAVSMLIIVPFVELLGG